MKDFVLSKRSIAQSFSGPLNHSLTGKPNPCFGLSINFLGNYTVSEEIFNDFDLSSYIGLVRASVLASGLIFELPIIIYFLTKIGLVTPEILIKYRKFALVGVLVLAAVITPPDVASQIIVAIPIVILYQISIYISRIVVKNNN